MAKRVIIQKSDKSYVRRDDKDNFVVPRGKDLSSVTRDASRQVIEKYGPALEKLKRH